jgi:hypothetical protein
LRTPAPRPEGRVIFDGEDAKAGRLKPRWQ